MSAGVNVDGGIESADVYRLSDATFDPVLFVVQHRDVLSTKMVAFFPGMLEHGRLVIA